MTRNFFIDIFPNKLDIPVEVRDLTRAELYASDEIFLCGTGGEVTPITSIDDIRIGEHYPGLVSKKIADYYSNILSGKVDEFKDWLTPI